MSGAANMNTYLFTHYQGKTPEELIQMLYKGALRNLRLAKQGIEEKNPRKRGEHLGKAIAIITELYTSIDVKEKDESILFLRELYSNMLTELPKVSLSNDPEALNLTYSYIKQLDRIWENKVLKGERHNNHQQIIDHTIKDPGEGTDVFPSSRSLFA